MTVALEEVTSSDCKQTADVNNKLPSYWYYLKIASLGSKEETQTKLIALYLTRSDLGAEGLFERDLPLSVALTGVTAQGPVRTILSVLDLSSFPPLRSYLAP